MKYPDIAELFMESLYFPDGSLCTANVDSVDGVLLTSEISQHIPDVIQRMFWDDEEFAKAVSLPPGLNAMVEQTNQYSLLQFARYAEYGKLPDPRDDAELGMFLDFCRCCHRYFPDKPRGPAVHSSMKWLRYLNFMWAIAFFRDIAGNIWDCSDDIVPPSVEVKGLMSWDDKWTFGLTITVENDAAHTMRFTSTAPSIQEAALYFNRLLLATPYRALGVTRGGIWESSGEIQS